MLELGPKVSSVASEAAVRQAQLPSPSPSSKMFDKCARTPAVLSSGEPVQKMLGRKIDLMIDMPEKDHGRVEKDHGRVEKEPSDRSRKSTHNSTSRPRRDDSKKSSAEMVMAPIIPEGIPAQLPAATEPDEVPEVPDPVLPGYTGQSSGELLPDTLEPMSPHRPPPSSQSMLSFAWAGDQVSKIHTNQTQVSAQQSRRSSNRSTAFDGSGSRPVNKDRSSGLAMLGSMVESVKDDDQSEGTAEDKEELYALRQLAYWVRGPIFKGAVSFTILINCICIGLQTQDGLQRRRETPGQGTNYSEPFQTFDSVFNAIFSVELVMRIIVDRKRFFQSKEKFWNMFDTLLVLQAVWDITFESISTAGPDLSVLRVLRMARFVRILRLVRVMKQFQSFRVMVYTIMHSLLSLLWVFALLLFVIYVFTVFILFGVSEFFAYQVDTSSDQYAEIEKLFGSVEKGLLTLFMGISGGADWGDIMRPLMDIHVVYGLAFVLYIFFVIFGVLNIVTSMFVDSAQQVSMKDREIMIQNEQAVERQRFLHIERFFMEADADASGFLSWEEFEGYLSDPDVRAYFKTMELDVSQAKALWILLDTDETNALSIGEFVEGCMRLRGNARSLDVALLLYENEKMISRLTAFMDFTFNQFVQIERAVGATEGRKLPSVIMNQSPLESALRPVPNSNSFGALKEQVGLGHS